MICFSCFFRKFGESNAAYKLIEFIIQKRTVWWLACDFVNEWKKCFGISKNFFFLFRRLFNFNATMTKWFPCLLVLFFKMCVLLELRKKTIVSNYEKRLYRILAQVFKWQMGFSFFHDSQYWFVYTNKIMYYATGNEFLFVCLFSFHMSKIHIRLIWICVNRILCASKTKRFALSRYSGCAWNAANSSAQGRFQYMRHFPRLLLYTNAKKNSTNEMKKKNPKN